MSLLPQPAGSGPALVLRRWTAGETSIIASALVEGHGFVRLLAKGARQSRSRLRALVEPGRLVELEFTLNPQRDLQYLRGGSVVLDPLAAAPALEKTACLLAALELVDRCHLGHGHEEGLFALCQAYVRVLSCADRSRQSGLFYAFEIALLALMGMRPQLEACTRCGVEAGRLAADGQWLSPAAGGLVCSDCAAQGAGAGAQPLGAAQLAVWPQLSAAPVRWPAVSLPRALARSWGIMLHRFLAYHLPGYRLPAALQLLRNRPEAPGLGADEENRA